MKAARNRIREIFGEPEDYSLAGVERWVRRFERRLQSGDVVIIRKTIIVEGTRESVSYRIEGDKK